MRSVAEDIVLPRFRSLTAADIEEKSPGDLVTVADRESEKRLSDGLAEILPDASILGEEAVAADPALLDRARDALCWIIDPIDGTHNFAHGRSPFGIMIALTEQGETLAGWIYDPVLNRLCEAWGGSGSLIDGERITARRSGREKPIAAISTLFLDDVNKAKLLHALGPKCDIVDIPRCAAEQYPRLALGTNDISIFERTLPWDHAAGVLFLNEAGGKVAHWDGTPFRPGTPKAGLLGASAPEIWDQVICWLGDANRP
jgi:fructose-1,6-bisphosphatase/inositol monophosphatase family enzyme